MPMALGSQIFKFNPLSFSARRIINFQQVLKALKHSSAAATTKTRPEENNEDEFYRQYVIKGPSQIAKTNFETMKNLYLLMTLRDDKDNMLGNNRHTIRNLLTHGSIIDIAMVASAYFKTKTIVASDDLLSLMMTRLIELLPTLNPSDPVYCSIIKAVRYTRRTPCRKHVAELATALKSSKKDIIFTSTYNLVQTLKLFEAYRIYDEELFDLMIEAVLKNTDQYRIKDLQYILTSLSNLSHCDILENQLLTKLLEKVSSLIVLKDRYDVNFHPYHLMPILRAFAIFNYYDKKLIDFANKAMGDRNTHRIMSKVLEFKKTCLIMFTATRIEAPDCPFGSTSLYDDEMHQDHRNLRIKGRPLNPNSHHSNKGGLTTFSTSNYMEELSSELSARLLQKQGYKLRLQLTFPFQNYFDLVVSKDSSWTGDFATDSLETRLVPPGEKHCLLYLIRSHDYMGDRKICGYKGLLMRMLKKLGYRILVVDYPQRVDAGLLLSKIESILEKTDPDSIQYNRLEP